MSWFNKNKRLQAEHIVTEESNRVEIIAHKRATKRQIAEVKKANDALNGLFARNNFTLTIYLAAGGKSPEHMSTKVSGETSKDWDRVPGKNKA